MNSGGNGDNASSTKFVHKLFRMVSDPEYQHLISWNANGTSVVVTNFDEFAKEVLGKHFKHSNFSSFIRQLNMYGFYKVNKTPRGHRHAVDTQIWEFSHPKFIRGRPDLLDDIRRKALDSEHAR
ncbi:winged helix DNA-binding domain-containing protein, partial [Meira miltonrushii]